MSLIRWTLALLVSASVSNSLPHALADDAKPAAASESDKASEDKKDAEKSDDKKSDDKAAEPAKEEPKKDEPAKSEEKKPERKTHQVEAKKLEITVDVEGVFAARETSEVVLRPEEWSDFKIVEVVPHGSTVKKGDLLIKFDSKMLDEAIEDLELELRIGELTMMSADQELPRATEEVQRSYDQAKRSLDEAKADYEYYRTVDREMSLKNAEMNLKSVKQMVENAKEELAQLEKMYEADDLTEETEEIVLKRQRAEVEQADFYLESYQKSYDQTLNVYIPRRDVQEKELLERVELAYERAKTALETDQSKRKYEHEQQKDTRRESLERHAKLLGDRELLEVRSPADGVVYYGGATDGAWGETASLIGSLREHGSASTETVLMTIVKPRPLYVIGTVGEEARPDLSKDQAASITTAATDGPKLKGKLTEMSNIPVGDNKYRVELSVDSDDLPEWIVAGLTAKAKLTTYTKDDALLVPKAAVKTDDKDDTVKYVMLVDAKDDKAEPKRKDVKVGKTKDDNVEIVEGLSAGDVVVLEDEAKKE